MISTDKKTGSILVIVGIIALLAIFYFYWSGNLDRETLQAKSFYGGLVSISPENPEADEVVIVVNGSFASEEQPEVAQAAHTLEVIIDTSTQIERTVVEWPTTEELEAAGWLFQGQDLKRETGPGSIRTLLQDFHNNPGAHINIFSEASANIYSEKKFTASSLRYEIIPKAPILD